MIFKGKQTRIIHNFTTDIDPVYNCIVEVAGGISWYMMESKDFISSVSVKLKNENNEMVSFIGQSITFRLPFKEF